MSEHEANNAILWISDKLWQSLNAEQKQWVLTAARDVTSKEPTRASSSSSKLQGSSKGWG